MKKRLFAQEIVVFMKEKIIVKFVVSLFFLKTSKVKEKHKKVLYFHKPQSIYC